MISSGNIQWRQRRSTPSVRPPPSSRNSPPPGIHRNPPNRRHSSQGNLYHGEVAVAGFDQEKARSRMDEQAILPTFKARHQPRQLKPRIGLGRRGQPYPRQGIIPESEIVILLEDALGADLPKAIDEQEGQRQQGQSDPAQPGHRRRTEMPHENAEHKRPEEPPPSMIPHHPEPVHSLVLSRIAPSRIRCML